MPKNSVKTVFKKLKLDKLAVDKLTFARLCATPQGLT